MRRYASLALFVVALVTACAPVIVVAGAGYMLMFERIMRR